MEEKIEEQREQFIILPARVFKDKRLSLADKLIIGRAMNFEEFFESATSTAEFLGISVKTVQTSKAKLEKLGILECICDTGHGKRYCVNYELLLSPQKAPERTEDSKTIKHPTSSEKSLESQNNGQLAQIEPQVPATKRNEDIDWAFEAWTQIVGVPQIANQKKNRYACHNLLKKQVTPNLPKGRETMETLIKLVRESKKDRYAPRIANFSELQSKLDNLMDWATRKREQTMGDENLIADLRNLGDNK